MLRAIVIVIGYCIGFIIGFSIVDIIKRQHQKKLDLKRKKYDEQYYHRIFGFKRPKTTTYEPAPIQDCRIYKKPSSNITKEEDKMQHECQCKQNKTNIIKVKYRDKTLPKLQNIAGIKSDWIDLYASQDYELKQGEFKLIELNVVVEIPKGYEGHIAPRSSTFKNFGIIQTNSVGVVDNSYCGDEDYLKMPVLAMRDTIINKGDRICQFRIFKKMEETIFEEVEVMDNENRGGIGSTGTN